MGTRISWGLLSCIVGCDGGAAPGDGLQWRVGNEERLSIADLRTGPPAFGHAVELHDVTVTSLPRLEYTRMGASFTVQDAVEPWSGITVVLASIPAVFPGVGEVLQLRGRYGVRLGQDELVVDADAWQSTGTRAEPSAAVLSVAQLAEPETLEAYRSMLVALEDVAVTDVGWGRDDFAIGADTGEITLEGRALSPLEPQPGARFDRVQGILQRVDGRMRLVPRSDGDVQRAPEGWSLATPAVADLQDREVQTAVPEFTRIRLEGLVITAARAGGTRAFAQAPTALEHGGLALRYAAPVTVQPGDVVAFEGRYQEIEGTASVLLKEPPTVLRSGALPFEPMAVALSDMAEAWEPLEGMWVALEGEITVAGASSELRLGDVRLDDAYIEREVLLSAVDTRVQVRGVPWERAGERWFAPVVIEAQDP